MAWLSGHVVSRTRPRPWKGLFGFTEPTKRAVPKQGESKFTEAWKAWEALQLTRAQNGWRKLKSQRRISVLDDVATFRTWYVPQAERETMVQSWLLPWLQGSFRHVYRGPWREKRNAGIARPKYTKSHFTALHPQGLALLPALPHSVAVCILRFAGHARSECGKFIAIADDILAQERVLATYPN